MPLSLRFSLLFFGLLFVAAASGQDAPPAKGKAPAKEEEDPKAPKGRKPIRIEDDAPAAPAEGPGVPPPPGVAVVAVRQSPERLSPSLARSDAELWALDLIFEGLVRPAADSAAGQHYEPALARELPALTPRGRAFTLADAVWTDPDGGAGRPVDAADVQTTVAKLHARRGKPGSERAELIERVFTDAARRCQLIFRAGHLDPLSLATFKVLPSSAADDDAFARRPTGSGPFVYAGPRSQGGRQYAVFTANPAYGRRDTRRNLPRLKEVWLLASRDPVADFRAGRVHLVLSPATGELARLKTTAPEGEQTPAKLETTLAHEQAKVLSLPSRRIYYLAVNHQNPLLGGKDGQPLRQFLASAIRRDAILTACFRAGHADHHQPLAGPFPPRTWPCSPRVGRLDDSALAESLKREVAAALRGQRQPVVLELKYPASDGNVERACQLIAEQVAELKPGFALKPVAVPPDKLRSQVEVDTDYQLAYRHYDFADDWFSPAGLLDPRANELGGRNFLHYAPPPDFDQLLVACQNRRDFGAVRLAMHRLHDEFRTELPFIPLWHLDTHVLLSDKLTTHPEPRRLDPLAPFTHIDQWQIVP